MVILPGCVRKKQTNVANHKLFLCSVVGTDFGTVVRTYAVQTLGLNASVRTGSLCPSNVIVFENVFVVSHVWLLCPFIFRCLFSNIDPAQKHAKSGLVPGEAVEH